MNDTLETLALLTDQLLKMEFASQAFFRKSPCLLMIATVDGEIRSVNPAWGHLLGWSVDELEGGLWMDLIHPDDSPQAHAAILDHQNSVETAQLELRFRCKNGSYQRIMFHAPDYDRHGLTYCVGVKITDVDHAGK